MVSEQSRSKFINFPIANGDLASISIEDIDYLCKIIENFYFSHLLNEMKNKDILKYMIEETW